MRRVLWSVLLAVATLAVFTSPAWAYLYRAQVSIVENGTANYTPMLGVSWNSSNTWMAANGFFTTATGMDTRVQTLGGLNKPRMLTTNQTFTAIPVAANTQTNLYFVTGETAASDMDIIPGYGGYVATTDNASLELSSNGTVGYSGYISTDVTGDVWTKGNAASLSTISDGRILLSTANVSGDNYNGSLDVQQAVWGFNWYAQTFTPAVSFNVSAAQLYTTRSGNPGNVAMSIRATAAGVPTGDNLTTGTANGNAWSAVFAWNRIDFPSPITLTAGTTYAIVLAAPSGSAINFLAWYYDNTAPTAGGQYCSSGDSGNTWAGNAANDFLYSAQVGLVIAAASGERVTSAAIFPTGANRGLSLTVGSTTVNWTDTTATIAIPNTTDNWVWLANTNATAYATNITLDNGVLRLRYDPNTIISGNILPNRAIANTDVGQFTWGTNPTGVSVTMGSVTSSGQPSVGGTTSTPTTNLLPVAGGADWNRTPDVSGTLLTNPLRPLVTLVSDNSTLTERQAWVWGGIMFVAFILVLAAKHVRGHQGITAVATGAAIVACVVQTIFPLWALVLAIPAIIGGILSERTPSV